tara:strand:- start:329 stop:520 length:192 start_codon:yes stop_codon:yes gene_type:complete
MPINPAFSGVEGKESCGELCPLWREPLIYKGRVPVDKPHIFLGWTIKTPDSQLLKIFVGLNRA